MPIARFILISFILHISISSLVQFDKIFVKMWNRILFYRDLEISGSR